MSDFRYLVKCVLVAVLVVVGGMLLIVVVQGASSLLVHGTQWTFQQFDTLFRCGAFNCGGSGMEAAARLFGVALFVGFLLKAFGLIR